MALTFHPNVMLDGEIRDDGPARGWPTPDQLVGMNGFSETIKVLGGKSAFFREHSARLRNSCQVHRLGWSTSDEELRARCTRLLHANRCAEGSLRIVVVRDARGDHEMIFSRDPGYPAQTYVRGFRLKTVPDSGGRPSGPAHKTTRHAKNLAAREVAHAAGCDEALFVGPADEILEGAVTNVFAVIGHRVVTPPLPIGILPGVARAQIVQRWSGVEEGPLTLGELLKADEVFVTNALLEVMPVSAIDEKKYSVDHYEVTRRLMDAFHAWQEETL